MDVDEFYRQPAAVPFKWEIKPGVPRNHHRLGQFPSHSPHQHHPPPQKLKPPPAVTHFHRPSNSLHSSSRTRSDRWRFSRSNLVEPEQVSAGCFPSPLPTRKSSKIVNRKPEPDYTSELETLSRWSVSLSSRKSVSPFRNSVSSSQSSFSSYQSSPRPTSDSEWAGFGLF